MVVGAPKIFNFSGEIPDFWKKIDICLNFLWVIALLSMIEL